ncbi:probable peptide ABC transporter permease protein y4tP [Treponema primitia ZAS-2]|uniref:Probable peptide ABC transporter permease protein y4tP n=1 Tax=Treponema primitia (strain ATCC BAA-887 / DSM 12427 / ZAS-2) TaxID=545694 RepID=F5YI64_TREPZ|nr:ABC transporter permease [Treponema primitia]AEF85418.1 probable peptide ABC transporter permease protein y4tP [Treponema primitia ZAS-2]
MFRYIQKRLLMMIPTLFGVSFIIFVILSFTPGDPGTMSLGQEAPPEVIRAYNEQLGFYDPLALKYVKYISKAVHGDLGISWRTNRPVINEIALKFPVTLRLASCSIFLSAALGIILGIISATRPYSVLDVSCTTGAIIFASMPRFWLGMIFMLVFALKLKWLPSNGIGAWRHYVLPTVVLSLPTAAQIMRLMRSTMLETMKKDYIRTAKAKGASKGAVTWKHGLKNALMPVITVIGMDFGYLLGGTVLVETVFSMSGIGTLMLNSIRNQDVPQIQGTALLIATLVCLVMLLVDILYAFLDPRLRTKYSVPQTGGH